MKPEKQRLIHDLLGDESRRETVLLAGTRVLRRRRFWRSAGRGLALLLVLLGAGLGLAHWTIPRPFRQTVRTESIAPALPAAMSLTDDQLLALFPDTPVGLATLSDGRKRLIFPRREDEVRFVTRL